LDAYLVLPDPEGNRLFGKAEKGAFVLLQVGIDDLNLLAHSHLLQILPRVFARLLGS
jgi:hypothetical protein